MRLTESVDPKSEPSRPGATSQLGETTQLGETAPREERSEAPLVLVADDEVTFRELYCQVLEEAGFQTESAGSAEEALELFESSVPAMVISDVRMPGVGGLGLLREVRQRWPMMPFLLVTAYSEVREAVEALRLGAVEYLSKPVDLDTLIGTVRGSLGIQDIGIDPELPSHALDGLVAESRAMRTILRDGLRVARSDATVLLTGESGTGKDELAQFIHRNGRRSEGPFVAVNCGAIPADLLPGALFGHQKGAFTGAAQNRLGYFQKADGGTLFLDEIGELPLELQPVLLRALETRRIAPLGGDGEVQCDVRIIAATNRQLESAVKWGHFRSDLFYRLNVITFELPRLADRPADIMPLARLFLSRSSHGAKRLSPAAAACIESHDWPGHVRELLNAITRAALLARSDVILPEHLPPAVSASFAAPFSASGRIHDERGGDGNEENLIGEAAPTPESAPRAEARLPGARLPTLKESERTLILRALTETDGNRTRAAEILGLSRRGLLNKIKRFGLE